MSRPRVTLADELMRRGIPALCMAGKRLVYKGILPNDGATRQEQAYILHQEGWALKEIAGEMKISVSAARQYVLREQRRLIRWTELCTSP